MTSEEKRFWKDVYTASLSGMLESGTCWKQGDKSLNDVQGYSSVARDFANKAVKDLRSSRL